MDNHRIARKLVRLARELVAAKTLYHVTHSKYVSNIKSKGILGMQTSNWVKRSGGRYGHGEVYAFENFEDAMRWASKMDWTFNSNMGSGKVSIISFSDDLRDWDVDSHDPLGQAGSEGRWLKAMKRIPPEQIRNVKKFDKAMMKKLVEIQNKRYEGIPEEAGLTAADRRASASGFMADYRSKTHEHPLMPEMRVWSYADDDGTPMPLVMTEMSKRRWEGEEIVWFHSILSPEKQGTGIASYVVKQIAKMADKNDTTIWLNAKPFGRVENALSASKLKAWYKRNGWETSHGETMVRRPQ